ncbi:sugar phosphate isomerase/epimerase [Rhodocytophaga rosea]|uniref:Sugar phosphate isomerase/epimerase n=1 Tax=Rhodocytophaga rosea TaxID=2704465 RepID=A0A6C0GPQ7_9BACT|nr:TIM barrel protein [Rhodocytophaga rosea]QHT70048.1 sugar phosphate isomerase/epimerase [Rhodocytophaga rosea]
MNILFFCPHWGLEQLSLEDAFRKIKDAGYDGVEMAVPFDEQKKEEFLKLLDTYQLLLIAQQWSAAGGTFAEYKASFEKHLYHFAEVKPLFINSQTGKDYYPFEQNKALIERAEQISKETGIKIVHETHRGKFSFCAAITRKFLENIPSFTLAADFSHWCNVSESFLQDQKETVQVAIGRSAHIHSRVGHTQAAQVSDPRAPEWQEAVEHHLVWWDAIIEHQKKSHNATFTITPEFGPWPYMPALPFTRQPITSQWEVNLYMRDLLKKRYAN